MYVDNDQMVLSHAQALMTTAPGGAIGHVDADVRDPDVIVAGARATLDFSRPVAILLLATLAFVEDAAEAAAVVSKLAAAAPCRSYVAIWHLASGFDPMLDGAVRRWNASAAQRMRLRSRSQVADLVAGLELVPPGLVPVTDWRAAPDDPGYEKPVPVYGLVARKP